MSIPVRNPSLFESYNKLNTQCIKAQGENENAMADVEGGLLENEELDAKILEVESTTRRVASLSAIRDRKLNAIFSDLEHRYPDIAGSSLQSSRSRSWWRISM